MRILFAASEVAPFIKTGGLADVAGSLPSELAKAGHEVKVVLPLYEGISQQWRDQMFFNQYFYVTLAWRRSYCGVFSIEKDGVSYWFIDNEYYFRRSELYGHFDDAERFAFFSRAVIELSEHMGYYPDIIHCNDWQTALVPIYLLEERHRLHTLANTRSVFTIHNIEYQGRYGKDLIEDIFGLDSSYIHGKMLEYYDDINLMKGAIYASDYVTTVSPTYANELQYDFYAHGLAGVVRECSGKIRGILNGLDVDLYDPAKDPALTASFAPADPAGKAACKEALQKAVGLNVDSRVPIVACVSRLVPHKGFDMVLEALHRIMECDLQMVVLGTGNWNYEEAFRQAQQQYPGRFAACIQYSASLSTAIYGGADLFLMPSIAEPCGLSQMIAMRYGTLPIVRETGGLRDSVPPFNAIEGTGLGFTFANATADDMLDAIHRSMQAWYDHPEAFTAMRTRAMEADFTWNRSAQEYLDIYHWITGIPVPGSEQPEVVPEEKPAPKKRTTKKAAAPAEKKTTAKKAPAEKKEPAKKAAPKTKKAPVEVPAVEEKPVAETPIAEIQPAAEAAPSPEVKPAAKKTSSATKTAKSTTTKSKSKSAPKE